MTAAFAWVARLASGGVEHRSEPHLDRVEGSEDLVPSQKGPQLRICEAIDGKVEDLILTRLLAEERTGSMLTSGRTATPLATHHCRARSSDRKKSMVLHVKTMSSHQCGGATSEWNSQSEDSGPSVPTRRCKGSRDCSHRESTVPGNWSAAGMARASHAQLAK